MQDGIFFAQLVFDGGAEVGARPSDSIALALRTGIPHRVRRGRARRGRPGRARRAGGRGRAVPRVPRPRLARRLRVTRSPTVTLTLNLRLRVATRRAVDGRPELFGPTLNCLRCNSTAVVVSSTGTERIFPPGVAAQRRNRPGGSLWVATRTNRAQTPPHAGCRRGRRCSPRSRDCSSPTTSRRCRATPATAARPRATPPASPTASSTTGPAPASSSRACAAPPAPARSASTPSATS